MMTRVGVAWIALAAATMLIALPATAGRVKSDKSALRANVGFAFSFAWAPDGTWFLVAGKNSFRKFDASGKKIGEIKLTKFAEGSPAISTFSGNDEISPDGSRVVFRASAQGEDGATTSRLWVLDLASGASAAITDGTSDVYEPSWMSDGKTIVYTKKSGHTDELYSLDVATKVARPLCAKLADSRQAIALPDGRILVLTMTVLHVTDLSCGTVQPVGPKFGLISGVSFSPDGTRATVVDLGDGTLWVVDLGGGSSTKLATQVLGSAGWYDADTVVFPQATHENDKYMSELRTIRPDGSNDTVLLQRTKNCSDSPVWSPPHGGMIAFSQDCTSSSDGWIGIVSALPK